MKVRRSLHLVRRYFGSLRARPIDDATSEWVAATLESGEQRVWVAMSRADRAEGVAVARAFEAGRPAGAAAASEWRAAALLHDAGKQCSGYGTFGRVVATIVVALAGKSRVRGWVGAGGVRARFGRYAAHDDLGADLLQAAGARPVVVAWAGAHHRPDRWASTGMPENVCRALAAADGEV